MPFKIAHTEHLALEVERAKGVLLAHMVNGQEYTVGELLQMLKDYGLDYSNPQYTEIGQTLLADGFLVAT